MWWCPCVELSLVLLEESVCYDQCVLLTKVCHLRPASFCTPRPNFLLFQITFDLLFCIPIPHDVKDIFTSVVLFFFSHFLLVLENLVGLYRTVNFSFFSISGWVSLLSRFNCVQFFSTLWTATHWTPPSWDSPGKNTWVGCCAFLQRIILTQGSNPHLLRLLHWQAGSFITSGSLGPMECLSENQESLFVRVIQGILFSTEI